MESEPKKEEPTQESQNPSQPSQPSETKEKTSDSNYFEQEKLRMMNKQMEGLFRPKNKYEIKEEYKFWSEQPVPQFNKEIGVSFGPIEKDNKVENERKEPYTLPEGFEWQDVDVTKDSDLTRLYEFLKNNYVEDSDHMFRFDYNKEFLKWHLTPPGMFKEWLVSVVQPDKKGKKKMIGFISGIPIDVNIHGTKVRMAEINFLCVNAKMRDKRLAPVLIKEITRRVHLHDMWQALYTSGTMLPKPFSITSYYHRFLNIKKLVDIGFTYLKQDLNMAKAKILYKVKGENTITGIRPMEEKDVDAVTEILEKHLNKFKVHGYYSKEEVKHWFLPRKNVIFTYVIDNGNGPTDLISFYSLCSSILKHEDYKTLYAAYSFFNVANTVSFKELMRNAVILAKNNGFDVFNCLNVMENQSIAEDLLFVRGDGRLKYYFYNFVCPETEPNDLALVLM